MNNRIQYIDALRGFAMLLVVYGHIVVFSSGDRQSFNFWDVTQNVQMPLFFFISGFVCYKAQERWILSFMMQSCLDKIRQLILPTILFLTLFTIVFDVPIKCAFYSVYKSGYWFPLILFCYFAIYATCMTLATSADRKRRDGVVLYSCFFLFAVGISLYVDFTDSCEKGYQKLLSLPLYCHFMYFVAGVCCRRYYPQMYRLLRTRGFLTMMIVAFVAAVIWRANGSYMKYVMAWCWIILAFAFFWHYRESFSDDKIIGRTFQYIGRRTLDIYLIHYFVVPRNLSPLISWFEDNPNPAMEFFVEMLIAFAVVAMSCVISAVLRMSPQLRWLMMGKLKS